MSFTENLGYKNPIFILAFDHRSSFVKKMFGISGGLTKDQAAMVRHSKKLIFEGFKTAVAASVPVKNAAILTDEEFGDEILREARAAGYQTILCTEKSGKDEYDFEYGENFQAHIEKFKPKFTKALVRYNPEGDKDLNSRQAKKLKELSDYSHENGYKFLIEPLVPATEEQMKAVGGDEKKYDSQLRPKLMIRMIRELQDAGVEPDIWKIEGLEEPEQYKELVKQARINDRSKVSAVVLGRAATDEQVEKWLRAGAGVEGVIGFAIGRTIFWDALTAVRDHKTSLEEAVKQIARKYAHFYKVFTEARPKK